MRIASGTAALLLCLFLPLPVLAKTYPSLSLAGGVMLSSESPSDGALLAGVKGGYWWFGRGPRESLGVEAVFLRGNKADLTLLRGDVLYPFMRKGRWKTYVSAGMGGIFRDSGDAALAAFGAAVEYQADSPFSLRFDTRHLRELGDGQESDWEITLQLGYEFGYRSKPKPKPRPDSDDDGVHDGADRCPNTPKELAVDQQGCPKNPPDLDRDRIPDYLDRCPGTPAGVKVAADGCPPDADADGIPDSEDRCPNNAPGLLVGEDGCVKIQR